MRVIDEGSRQRPFYGDPWIMREVLRREGFVHERRGAPSDAASGDRAGPAYESAPSPAQGLPRVS